MLCANCIDLWYQAQITSSRQAVRTVGLIVTQTNLDKEEFPSAVTDKFQEVPQTSRPIIILFLLHEIRWARIEH